MQVVTTHPTLLVIFGATGNLAETKIFPSIFDLLSKGSITDSFHVVAFARKPFTDAAYRELISMWVKKTKKAADEDLLRSFLSRIYYVQGNFDEAKAYQTLQEKLIVVDEKVCGTCSNKLFYLATPPTLYENILNQIALSGLSIPCIGPRGGWTRLLIEKPFGNDLETARSLDHLLGLLFEEDQIFRIDHYLAKETLQNILAFRFANGIFEPLWNKDHIVSVDIVMSESKTVGNRGAFYDGIGALKDVGQNHLLQMLALITLERPADFTASSVRDARALICKTFISPKKEDVVRARYTGYTQEENVSSLSETETAFLLRTFIDTPRWKGVPFYLGSGKGFAESEVSITLYFKRPPMNAFGGEAREWENALTFHIQPKEGIELSFLAKRPGFDMEVEDRHLSFSYPEIRDSEEGRKTPNAYERVLFDCIKGDQTLFASTAEVDASWSYVASIVEAWQGIPLKEYEVGTSFRSWARNHFKEGFGDPLKK